MLKLDPRTRMIEGGYPLGMLDRCFQASERLKPFLKQNKDVEAYGSVTIYTTEKEMPLELILPEVVKRLSQELTIDQQYCGHDLKSETEIIPMHESIAGRITSLHAWCGEEFLDQVAPRMLVFLAEREALIPVIMRYNKEEKKCFGDIAEGVIPQGTKILLVRGQKVQPA
jgi:hypothetical protein